VTSKGGGEDADEEGEEGGLGRCLLLTNSETRGHYTS
jgi:hypothetical protein